MKLSWILGKLDEEYSIDDLIDMHLQVKALVKDSKSDKSTLYYYQHCFQTLTIAFDFDTTKAIMTLNKIDSSLLEMCERKALQIRTPISGYQMATTFYSDHGEDLKEIKINTRKLIQTYRNFIAFILTKNFRIKEKVTRYEMLKAGYDARLLPEDDDDIF